MGDTKPVVAKVVTVSVPNFTRTFMEKLWSSFVDNYKVDVEITCHGHSVRAHQLILALFCSTFKKTFDITDTGDHQLETKLLNFDQVVERGGDLELLIEFIYRGSVTLPADQLDGLKGVAATLEFELLLEAIENARNPKQPLPPAAPPTVPEPDPEQSEDENGAPTAEDSEQSSGNRRKRRKPIPRKLFLMNSELPRGLNSKRGGHSRLSKATKMIKSHLQKPVTSSRRLRAQPPHSDHSDEDGNIKTSNREVDGDEVQVKVDPDDVEEELSEQSETEEEEEDEEEEEAPRRKRRKVAGGAAAGGGRRGRPPKGRAPRKQTKPRRKKLLSPVSGEEGDDGEKATRAEYKKSWRQSRPLLKCPQCSYETQDKESYRSHAAKHDPTAKRFVCDICSKKFRSKRGFLCHCRGHQGPDQLHQCLRCPFQTPQKSSWTQHLAVIHKIDQQGNPLPEKYKCHECSYSCVADHKLKAHIMRKHTAEKPFKCLELECNYSTFLKYDLEKHIIIRHKKERPYMCETCGFRSQTQSGYARHRRSHTGEKPFCCGTCGQVYADGRKLRIHLQRHLSDDKPYLCHLCSHACRRKDNLQMHLRRIHKKTLDGEKALPVEVVGLPGQVDEHTMATQDEIAAAMAAATASTSLEVQLRASAAAAAATLAQHQHQQHFQHPMVVTAAADGDKGQQEITFIVPSSLPINYMEYHVPI